MANPRICSSCLPQLANCRHLGRSTRLLATSHRNYTAIAPATPLFLDFLAPAQRTQASPSMRSQALRPPTSRIRATEHGFRRTFSSTSPPRHAKAILNPRNDDDGQAMNITITPRAAHRLRAIATQDANPDLALRVSVESGGCHGFQYLMSLVNARTDVDGKEDTVFEEESQGGGRGGSGGGGDGEEYRAKVVMDEPSLDLLKGSSVDYTMELIGSQFKVVGIPGAKSSCGCGTSFDIAA